MLIDETDGNVRITLPKTTDTQSKYVQFFIAITTNSDNEVTVFPANGDTFKGELTQKVFQGYGKAFIASYLFDTVWLSASTGG